MYNPRATGLASAEPKKINHSVNLNFHEMREDSMGKED